MGRSPCCDKVGLKKGPWTPEEDQKLLAYIEEHGHGSWRALPTKAGLQRCGKSCRLRWINYLRPDIKRGKFSLQEEQTIIQLHALLGNRWSAIATHLPKRTDNEIKNYWNTHLKKRLTKMGIDPVTHKPKNDALLISDGQSKSAANLSHIAQWESARLEAEARLVRESRLRSHSSFQQQLGCFASSSCTSTPAHLLNKSSSEHQAMAAVSRSSLDVLKVWNGGGVLGGGVGGDLESPTSTLTFSEHVVPPIMAAGGGENSIAMIEFVGSSSSSEGFGNSTTATTQLPEYKEGFENSISFASHDMRLSIEGTWTAESLRTSNEDHVHVHGSRDAMEEDQGFTNLLLNNVDERSLSDEDGDGNGGGDSDNGSGSGSGREYYEDNKNYWNSILNLVNSSPSDSSMF